MAALVRNWPNLIPISSLVLKIRQKNLRRRALRHRMPLNGSGQFASPKVDPTEGDDHSNDSRRHQDEAAVVGSLISILEEARESHRAGHLREALRLYRRITSAQPDCADAILPAAKIELQLGDAGQALELVERAIALKPESAKPHIIRAKVLQALGRLDDAATSCGRAIEIDPDYAGAYDMLGTILVKLAKLDDAEAVYRCAIDLAPNLAGSHYNLGNLMQLRGRPDEAEAAYCRALEIVPESATITACLAMTLEQQARFVEAEVAYRHAIDLAPQLASSYNNLANMLQQIGRIEEAQAIYRRALELEPAPAGTYNNLGLVLQKMARLDEAESALRRAIEIQPRYAAAYSNLAHVLLERGNAQAALAMCNTCLELKPLKADALAYKAIALEELGMRESARDLLDFDTLIQTIHIPTPSGFDSVSEFNRALARQVCAFPTRFSETGTDMGRQTQELMVEPKGPLAVLQGLIRKAVENYAVHPIDRPTQWQLDAWGTILKGVKMGERTHIHPTAWMSGVYYVATAEVIHATDPHHAGWIEFGRSPSHIHHTVKPRVRMVRPEEGLLLLFPSYFYHRVLPFNSSGARVSVAFDVKPLN
jgi:uncharacterized protein (TIGR02466 family)